jgi:hypothetical protein
MTHTNRDQTPAADQSNAGEGADPASEIKKQNPGETTTADLAGDEGENEED